MRSKPKNKIKFHIRVEMSNLPDEELKGILTKTFKEPDEHNENFNKKKENTRRY